ATQGKFTADEAMAFFKGWKTPDSPRGPIMIDPETRDIVQNVYIRRVQKQDGKLVNVEIATIPMVKDPWKQLNPPEQREERMKQVPMHRYGTPEEVAQLVAFLLS